MPPRYTAVDLDGNQPAGAFFARIVGLTFLMMALGEFAPAVCAGMENATAVYRFLRAAWACCTHAPLQQHVQHGNCFALQCTPRSQPAVRYAHGYRVCRGAGKAVFGVSDEAFTKQAITFHFGKRRGGGASILNIYWREWLAILTPALIACHTH